MKRKHVAAGAVALAAIAGGTAIAATSQDKQTENAIISDAAKQLGVKPGDLRQALADAENAQLDAAVKAGRLTQAQADAIKQHRAQEGTVLGMDHHGPGFGHDMGPGGPGPFDDLAAALGITEEQLHSQLESGKTLAEIAKANGKTLDQVKAALGREIDEHLSHLGDMGRFGPPGEHGRIGPWGRHP